VCATDGRLRMRHTSNVVRAWGTVLDSQRNRCGKMGSGAREWWNSLRRIWGGEGWRGEDRLHNHVPPGAAIV